MFGCVIKLLIAKNLKSRMFAFGGEILKMICNHFNFFLEDKWKSPKHPKRWTQVDHSHWHCGLWLWDATCWDLTLDNQRLPPGAMIWCVKMMESSKLNSPHMLRSLSHGIWGATASDEARQRSLLLRALLRGLQVGLGSVTRIGSGRKGNGGCQGCGCLKDNHQCFEMEVELLESLSFCKGGNMWQS